MDNKLIYFVLFFTSALTIDDCSKIPSKRDVVFEAFLPIAVQPITDSRFCASFPFPNGTFYINAIAPHVIPGLVVHISLYLCKEPGSVLDRVWDCKERQLTTTAGYTRAPECEASERRTYSFGLGEHSELSFPPGAGFKVGTETDSKWLVLSYHYLDTDNIRAALPDGKHDNYSGIVIGMKSQSPIDDASNRMHPMGTFGMESFGSVPPHSISSIEGSCLINQSIVMHPITVSMHTHEKGISGSIWRVRNHSWSLITRQDTRALQFWRPVNNSLTLRQGDILAFNCVFNNTDSQVSQVRAVGLGDDMCEPAMTYFVDGESSDLLQQSKCESQPGYEWRDDSRIAPVPEVVYHY